MTVLPLAVLEGSTLAPPATREVALAPAAAWMAAATPAITTIPALHSASALTPALPIEPPSLAAAPASLASCQLDTKVLKSLRMRALRAQRTWSLLCQMCQSSPTGIVRATCLLTGCMLQAGTLGRTSPQMLRGLPTS